jgi:hypothetical protein
MVPIIHLLFIINVAHPAIGSALDVFGSVSKHTLRVRWSVSATQSSSAFEYNQVLNSRTEPKNDKARHAKGNYVREADVHNEKLNLLLINYDESLAL